MQGFLSVPLLSSGAAVVTSDPTHQPGSQTGVEGGQREEGGELLKGAEGIIKPSTTERSEPLQKVTVHSTSLSPPCAHKRGF